MLLTDVRYCITQNPERDILEHVDIRVDDGRIVEIGEDLTRDDSTIDCSDRAVLPGLVNAHTHAGMNVMRGISDDKPLQAWLEEDIFPAEEFMDHDAVYYGTLHAIAEMVQTGTTCFNDMYLGKPAAEAVDDFGMRAVIARGVTDTDGERDHRITESQEFLDAYTDHNRITPVAAPHAVYTCSDELLAAMQAQAEEYDTLLHIHLSETQQENADCRDAHGMTPAAYLHDRGLLTERTVAAHGTWLTEHDMRLLQKTGAGVAHNPCANLKLGSGIADVPRLQAHDVTVGLGTDSVASNNSLNLFEEAKFAALLHKRDDPRQMTAQDVLDMLTVDGAELLGLDDQIGSIARGQQADLITVALDDIGLSPQYGTDGLVSNLVYAFNGRVTDVFVQGDPLLRDGALQTIDGTAVSSQVQQVADRIRTA
jgi:5-methylthioadenosine/S-adenosylhomocysteine deaminase